MFILSLDGSKIKAFADRKVKATLAQWIYCTSVLIISMVGMHCFGF